MNELYIDATDQILGRMASRVAKRLLKGDKIFIVNAEKTIVSGKPQVVFDIYKARISRGDPYNGPFYPNVPDMMVKRTVRGMLPKGPRGRETLKRLRVFLSVPEELKNKKFEKIKEAENNLTHKYVELREVSRVVSGRKIGN